MASNNEKVRTFKKNDNEFNLLIVQTMNICGMSQNKTIINPLRKLLVSGIENNIIIKSQINDIRISGMNNKIIIQSHINKIAIIGMDNKINGLDINCIIDEITINGCENDINLNENCSQVKKTITGETNKFRINGNEINNNFNNLNNKNNTINNSNDVNRFRANKEDEEDSEED